MTTFKMPEPVAVIDARGRLLADGDASGQPLYTAEALRDVLEQAARISEKYFHSTTAKQIRAMKEQIK